MMAGRDGSYQRGDVVWTTDPFKQGVEMERLWLIVSSDAHPFYGEQYIGLGVTTTPRLISHPLRDEYWTAGGTPKPSYVAPWAVHSPRQEDIQPPSNYDEIDNPWQGTLKQSFVDDVVDELGIYIQ
jgi:hypothetical protein